MEIKPTTCCGIKECHGIRHITRPELFVQDIYTLVVTHEDRTAIIWFSDTTERTIGHAIEKYIQDHRLGTIIRTNPTKNKKSGNDIILWAWEIDNIALSQWVRPTNRVPGYTRGQVRLWKFKKFFKNLIPHPKLTIQIKPETTL